MRKIIPILMFCVASVGNAREQPNSLQPTRIDAAGRLEIDRLVIPPSDYWSPTFRDAYRHVATSALARPSDPPLMDAPKVVWDKYFSDLNSALAAPLAAERASFPVDIEETHIAGVPAAIIVPRGGVRSEIGNRVLIYLHGGISQGLELPEFGAIPLASLGGFKVIAIDYRQEPADRYPASSQDVAAVYRALLRDHKPESIGILGVSIGALITSQTTGWLSAHGDPRPGAIAIISGGIVGFPFPFGKTGDSAIWARGIATAKHESFDAQLRNIGWYLKGVSSNDASAYPGQSDATLAAFPPTLFVTGTRSFDMSPSVAAHAKLLKLGVDASLYVMEGGWHGAPLAVETPEGRDATLYLTTWLRRRLTQ